MSNARTVTFASLAAIAVGAFIFSTGAASSPRGAPGGDEIQLEVAQIYWEYNDSASDLGVHVSLDGEDWKRLDVENPDGHVIFDVRGKGPYAEFGLTELFFEGAEPALDEVPLDDLLAEFPEGEYEFSGRTVDGDEVEGEDMLTHAIPDGPEVFVDVGAGDYVHISWNPVNAPPPGFPNLPVNVVGYQVIVEPSFQVTVPASVLGVTVTPEFVATLPSGENLFEVLAIEASGNQTITEGSFSL